MKSEDGTAVTAESLSRLASDDYEVAPYLALAGKMTSSSLLDPAVIGAIGGAQAMQSAMTDAIVKDGNGTTLKDGDSVADQGPQGQGHVRDGQARHAGEEHPPQRQSRRDRMQHQAGEGPGSEDEVREEGVNAVRPLWEIMRPAALLRRERRRPVTSGREDLGNSGAAARRRPPFMLHRVRFVALRYEPAGASLPQGGIRTSLRGSYSCQHQRRISGPT